MKKTLVLVVDRDDDFGVKGKVNTPVIGVQNCLDAATAFGIADPEDSDLNALYAAVSACLELQEDGREADVALICGDEKVGHRSDLALVAQLEEVLDEIEPDSVVLVGDGAEDEYIYPIISSRAHVDSVRKVYVKQAPGLEGTFYIISKMLSDPDKRKRFMIPLGLLIIAISLLFLIPGFLVYLADRQPTTLSGLSGSMALFLIGLIILLYGYNTTERLHDMRRNIMASLVGRTTPIIFLCLAIAVVGIMAAYSAVEIGNLYLRNDVARGAYFISTMVWPIIIAILLYQAGLVIDRFMKDKEVGISVVFTCLGLASLGLVASGILDVGLGYINTGYGINVGIIEIILGIVLSISSNVLKQRMVPHFEEPADEALRLGPRLREDTRGHGVLARGGRGLRAHPQGRHHGLRPRRSGRHPLRINVHGVRRRPLPGGGRLQTPPGGHPRRLGILREEAAGPGDRAGRGGHGPGRGHPIPAGGQPFGRGDFHTRPRGQLRPRPPICRQVRGPRGPHDPVPSREHRLRLRRVHRRGPGRVHSAGDGLQARRPGGVRLPEPHAQGGLRP
ncbi:MAG: DUF373 family protein, partial [Thermoplasmata archaeon]|nr:DUF373 family protein [Thermoplasmata archaeon]